MQRSGLLGSLLAIGAGVGLLAARARAAIPAGPVAAPGRLMTAPLDSLRISSGYGMRGSDNHTGVDFAAAEGTPVYAVMAGECVVSAPSGQLNLYGNTVVLQHTAHLFSLYAHLAQRDVVRGQFVGAGQQIGTVGRSAGTRANPDAVFASSAAHLHFELLTAWPPRGRDLDRLEPLEVLRAHGLSI